VIESCGRAAGEVRGDDASLRAAAEHDDLHAVLRDGHARRSRPYEV
jgi:hypothetical protein